MVEWIGRSNMDRRVVGSEPPSDQTWQNGAAVEGGAALAVVGGAPSAGRVTALGIREVVTRPTRELEKKV